MAYFGGSNIECEGCFEIFKVKSQKWARHKPTCHDPVVKRMMQSCYEAETKRDKARQEQRLRPFLNANFTKEQAVCILREIDSQRV